MLVVLYRWRVRTDYERQFVESWSAITAHLQENCNSLGSRLHRGGDGLWYGYAQWKSVEERERAFTFDSETVSEASRTMRAAIVESYPETLLDVVADFLVLPDER